jgi:modification methylase
MEYVVISSEKRRPVRVPFGALVENGYLLPGDTLYFRGRLDQQARVLANGHIRYIDGAEGSIHAVARHVSHAPCNGWEVWYYRDKETGKLLPLDALRQRFLCEARASLK